MQNSTIRQITKYFGLAKYYYLFNQWMLLKMHQKWEVEKWKYKSPPYLKLCWYLNDINESYILQCIGIWANSINTCLMAVITSRIKMGHDLFPSTFPRTFSSHFTMDISSQLTAISYIWKMFSSPTRYEVYIHAQSILIKFIIWYLLLWNIWKTCTCSYIVELISWF